MPREKRCGKRNVKSNYPTLTNRRLGWGTLRSIAVAKFSDEAPGRLLNEAECEGSINRD